MQQKKIGWWETVNFRERGWSVGWGSLGKREEGGVRWVPG